MEVAAANIEMLIFYVSIFLLIVVIVLIVYALIRYGNVTDLVKSQKEIQKNLTDMQKMTSASWEDCQENVVNQQKDISFLSARVLDLERSGDVKDVKISDLATTVGAQAGQIRQLQKEVAGQNEIIERQNAIIERQQIETVTANKDKQQAYEVIHYLYVWITDTIKTMKALNLEPEPLPTDFIIFYKDNIEGFTKENNDE